MDICLSWLNIPWHIEGASCLCPNGESMHMNVNLACVDWPVLGVGSPIWKAVLAYPHPERAESEGKG
jgi:hypothetical protein